MRGREQTNPEEEQGSERERCGVRSSAGPAWEGGGFAQWGAGAAGKLLLALKSSAPLLTLTEPCLPISDPGLLHFLTPEAQITYSIDEPSGSG